MKKHIPNVITLLNLLCGTSAIFLIYKHEDYLFVVPMAVLAASVFDFLDGLAARLLKAKSLIGKDLDSLADMVSFGLVPALLLSRIADEMVHTGLRLGGFDLIIFLPMLLAAFSALRLARFNNDTRQEVNFRGLATPANALFISSLALLLHYPASGCFVCSVLLSPAFFAFLILLLCYLLVCKLEMFSLKFKTLTWKNNEHRWIFLILGAGLFAAFSAKGLVAVIPLYVVLSLLQTVRKRLNQSSGNTPMPDRQT